MKGPTTLKLIEAEAKAALINAIKCKRLAKDVDKHCDKMIKLAKSLSDKDRLLYNERINKIVMKFEKEIDITLPL